MKIGYRGRTLLCRGWPLQRRTGQKVQDKKLKGGGHHRGRPRDKESTYKSFATRGQGVIHKYTQVFTSIHKYTQVFTSIHKYSQVFTSIHKYTQVFTSIHKYSQVSTRVPIRVYKKKNKKNNTYLDCKVCVINALCRD
jgi:hypothetical protein